MNYCLWVINAIIPIATFFVLSATLIVVAIYTYETKKLRKAAQEQIELQLMPFVLLHNQQSNIVLLNAGYGTAVNIKVRRASTKERFIPHISSIYKPIPSNFLSKDQKQFFCESNEITRDEYLIEFENINTKRYFVRQKYKADENMPSITTFEILEFGPVI